MNAAQFVIDHILGVLGGALIVVTALAAFLGKVWSARIIQREKADLQKVVQVVKDEAQRNLTLLESEFKLELLRQDQFHQISKATFEKIFDKKIAVYAELIELKLVFDKFRNEDGSFHWINPTEGYHQRFNDIRQAIEKNRMYISNGLAKAYDAWYEEAAKYLRDIEEVEIEETNHADDPSSFETMERVYRRQEKIIHDLIMKTFVKMDTLVNQIESDVAHIRQRMALHIT